MNKTSACIALACWCFIGTLSGEVAAAESSLLPLPATEIAAPGTFTVAAETPVQAAAGDSAALAAARYFVELSTSSAAVPVGLGRGHDAIRFVTDHNIGADRPDSYRLRIEPDGITISAASPSGLFYGGITLWQLLTEHPGTQSVTLTARTIDDGPRFVWRGLMLDSARHFQSPAYIRHFINWMAIHKLNVLHWHLTDDQAWRIEIKHYPRLSEVGGWRVPAGPAAAADIDAATGQPRKVGGVYSQDEIRDIVAYAAARHVTIVPEIEMPGHATAAIAAYPELGVAPVDVTGPSSDWGVFDNLYNVDESTFAFTETVLTEVMSLFPGPFIHVGGDEAVKTRWHASPAVQARMKALGLADEAALQGYFTARIATFLTQHGRRLIGWDEILEGGSALPSDAAVMSWRGIDGAVAAAKAGHDTVLSPSPVLYFDNRQGTSPAEPPGRGELVTLEDVYRFAPLPAALTSTEQTHILGIQANLWTEHLRTEEQLTRMAYPRAAALAEIAWSPAESHDWRGFSERLHVQQQRYRRIGLADDENVGRTIEDAPPERRYSQDLKLCTNRDTLALEDDAPIEGPRAVFLIDIANPCWIDPQVDLTTNTHLTVNIGQVPYNFQPGADKQRVRLLPPHSPAGELEVRIDACEGAPIASLPLLTARDNNELSSLTTTLPGLVGRHDLCFRFTGNSPDPLWAVNWVELTPTAVLHDSP